jgi:hypothetical protein
MSISKDIGGEIYMATNTKTGLRYIGQTTLKYPCGRRGGAKARWVTHCRNATSGSNECRALVEAIREYGKDAFVLEVLLQCDQDQLDNYERKFIKVYNTLHPYGYNLESGGSGCKKMSRQSREIISSRCRFRYTTVPDKEKIFAAMEEAGISAMPFGFHYSHNTKTGYEGFVVNFEGKKKRAFTAKGRTLSEKLKQALTFASLVQKNDKEQLELFDKEIIKQTSILIKNAKKPTEPRVLEAMKNIGVSEIPLYTRYEKRHQRFYVKPPNETCRYFKKHDPEESLRQSIEYISRWQQRESV